MIKCSSMNRQKKAKHFFRWRKCMKTERKCALNKKKSFLTTLRWFQISVEFLPLFSLSLTRFSCSNERKKCVSFSRSTTILFHHHVYDHDLMTFTQLEFHSIRFVASSIPVRFSFIFYWFFRFNFSLLTCTFRQKLRGNVFHFLNRNQKDNQRVVCVCDLHERFRTFQLTILSA